MKILILAEGEGGHGCLSSVGLLQNAKAGTLGSQDTKQHCRLRQELVRSRREIRSGVKGSIVTRTVDEPTTGGCGAWWPAEITSAAFDESGLLTVVRILVSSGWNTSSRE
jgi:hypothetical protein